MGIMAGLISRAVMRTKRVNPCKVLRTEPAQIRLKCSGLWFCPTACMISLKDTRILSALKGLPNNYLRTVENVRTQFHGGVQVMISGGGGQVVGWSPTSGLCWVWNLLTILSLPLLPPKKKGNESHQN